MTIVTKFGMPVLGLVACVIVFVFVPGCKFEERDWTRAQAANTVEAYAAFLDKHTQGHFADLARKEIEQREWKLAASSDTIDAYQAFIAKHPSGEHVDAARQAIDGLEWKLAASSDTIDAYKAFIAKHPSGAHVDAARQAVDGLERRSKLAAILAKHDMKALQSFVADDGNERALDRFKTVEGGTLTVASQPEEAIKGYRLQVARSKKTGAHDIVILIPAGAKLNIKSFGFSDGTKVNFKGAVKIGIVDGKIAPLAAAGKVTLTTTVKDTSVVKLASEHADIAPNVFLHVSDSEIVFTRADETSLQRDPGSKSLPGSGGTKFSVTKGKLYLLALR